jgi:hypothetical protein
MPLVLPAGPQVSSVQDGMAHLNGDVRLSTEARWGKYFPGASDSCPAQDYYGGWIPTRFEPPISMFNSHYQQTRFCRNNSDTSSHSLSSIIELR